MESVENTAESRTTQPWWIGQVDKTLKEHLDSESPVGAIELAVGEWYENTRKIQLTADPNFVMPPRDDVNDHVWKMIQAAANRGTYPEIIMSRERGFAMNIDDVVEKPKQGEKVGIDKYMLKEKGKRGPGTFQEIKVAQDIVSIYHIVRDGHGTHWWRPDSDAPGRYNKRMHYIEEEDIVAHAVTTLVEEHGVFASKNRIDSVKHAVNSEVLYERVEWDPLPHIDVFEDCLVDRNTGKVYNPEGEYPTRGGMPYKYNPDAKCPKILRFLNECHPNNPDMVEACLELLAHAILHHKPKAAVVWCIVGDGANGKSVFTEITQKLVGIENCASATADNLKDRDTLAYLADKRVMASTENKYDDKTPMHLIKSISSGDRITVRKNHGHAFDIQPQLTIMLSGNEVYMGDVTKSMGRRIRVIPWLEDFEFDSDDPEFEAKTKRAAEVEALPSDEEEIMGLYNLVRGRAAKMVDGWRPQYGNRIEDTQDDFGGRDAVLKQFIENRGYEYDPVGGRWVGTVELHEKYVDFCKSAGFDIMYDVKGLGNALTKQYEWKRQPHSVPKDDGWTTRRDWKLTWDTVKFDVADGTTDKQEPSSPPPAQKLVETKQVEPEPVETVETPKSEPAKKPAIPASALNPDYTWDKDTEAHEVDMGAGTPLDDAVNLSMVGSFVDAADKAGHSNDNYKTYAAAALRAALNSGVTVPYKNATPVLRAAIHELIQVWKGRNHAGS